MRRSRREALLTLCAPQHGDTALAYAADVGSLPCTIALLAINGGEQLETHDMVGWTPLHRAARNGREAVLSELLGRGAAVSV